MTDNFPTCVVPRLSLLQSVQAQSVLRSFMPAQRIAVFSGNTWPMKAGGVVLPTGFMEPISAELRNRIMKYLNKWNATGVVNVRFVHSTTDAVIRISRGAGGYYSYMGTDCLGIPRNQQTMNLEGFTMQTSDEECDRVIAHEAGHALGCPHEHSRPEIIARLDARKVIAEFRRTQGWTAKEIREQILTPLSPSQIKATAQADETSIMTYSFGGNLTLDGKPILGGSKITAADYEFMSRIYPMSKPVEPTDPADPQPTEPATKILSEFTLLGRRLQIRDMGPA